MVDELTLSFCKTAKSFPLGSASPGRAKRRCSTVTMFSRQLPAHRNGEFNCSDNVAHFSKHIFAHTVGLYVQMHWVWSKKGLTHVEAEDCEPASDL